MPNYEVLKHHTVTSYAKQLSRATLGRAPQAKEQTVAVVPKKSRAAVGKLSRIANLPDDVLLEVSFFTVCLQNAIYQSSSELKIPKHLHPRDILNLARTSKYFRQLLMSKRSRSVWRAARTTIGLPDCPCELSEPQYATLVFSTDCQVSKYL